MRKLAWVVGVYACVVFSYLPAVGEVPATFFDETQFNLVQAELKAMPEAEIIAFLGYLADCKDRLKQRPSDRQICKSSRNKFQALYRRSRTLDGMIDELEQLFEARALIREYVPESGNGIAPIDRAQERLEQMARTAFQSNR